MIDIDHSGEITLQNAKDFVAKNDDKGLSSASAIQQKKSFDQVDFNSDGKISYSEFLAASVT